ncbi:NAD-glutamate dehydrogenase [Nocardia yamanashiensis]|uniref:NAD-glutamate dehydrogenase n=1 Tax=Nocardia yamanashiensis TaxID=209247 RepID=UPI00082A99B4|nr:NAD-glutamate dehydrogenase [Nocardia yamanashiensis]
MVTITQQQRVSLRKIPVEPLDLNEVYFRWLAPSTPAATVAARAEHILRAHRSVAATRRPGIATMRVYRPQDDAGLGAAIQIVNDDMPLLVDSVSSMLHRLGATVTQIVHPVFHVLRDKHGQVRAISHAALTRAGEHDLAVDESWIHVQLGTDVADDILDQIEADLPPLLAAVRQIAADAADMSALMHDAARDLANAPTIAADGESTDYPDLLRWFADGRFTVLGYRYEPAKPGAGEEVPERSAPLGICHERFDIRPELPVHLPDGPVLRLATLSLDAVLPGSAGGYLVSIDDFAGERAGLRGTHHFVGTFTVIAQHENILDIPVISRRVRKVIDWADFGPDSYSGQELLEMLQSFPRTELFSTDARRLFETVSAVMDLSLRRQVRLFVRTDPRSAALYCLVYLPRDRYSTEVRLRMQDILRAEFDAEQIAYSARATESELAVVYFTVHRREAAQSVQVTEAQRERVQELLFATTRTWGDLLVAETAAMSEVSPEIAKQYAAAYPVSYQQEFTPTRALADLDRLRRLTAGDIDTHLYRHSDAAAGEWRFTLYVHGEGVSLSRVLPILHSLGVEVVDERPYRLDLPGGESRWIYDFGLRVPAAGIDLDTELAAAAASDADNGLRRRFADAVAAMWFGHAEIDALNELVLRSGLRWRQIAVLRGYSKYLRQTGFPYTFGKIARVLLAHTMTARNLVELFEVSFDVDAKEFGPDARYLVDRLRFAIDDVVSLDEDRILRALLSLVEATLRTNYYVTDDAGLPRDYLSFKLDPQRIAELPKPRPQFEIFVYSPRVEGVHLRFGTVARGGLRWSDRVEDFRTEILGLVKAQAVKNAVIVPVGAKGGFVVKQPPAASADPVADRQALQAEGIACYRTFISGLLDVTDNVDRATGAVVPPPRVLRRDSDDTYLVVAADKGTATFSDIANDVAQSYGFWLGDAFASGGSAGYDHKAMGITARGAWESVKRHFAEMDIDTQTQDFTVVGVGDMSGDVFGNGMLLSRHIRLVAAFDHRHIFLDPNPDAATSFAERERMFALPRSSWADYDRSLISEGGGVFDRTVKSIPISEQARKALGLPPGTTTLAPPELVTAILKAPADLLWNGGIGTYIKAATETNAEVGDKSNDAVRVNANELRVKVIGEGGNLGATALGRIEFCRNGGKMNTDAIDNSAGVDCSDHEVNIKILLDGLVSSGELAQADRNPLLASMTDEVAELVLRDNISQNFQLGISRAQADPMAAVHRRMLLDLETRRALDRELEALPSDAEMQRRVTAGTGLTSPELACLLAHVKLALTAELLAGELPDNPAMSALLPAYFPEPLRSHYAGALHRHPLRREIIATAAVNRVVDDGGISYVFRLVEEMGVTTDDAVRAFTAVTEIFGLPELWQRIRTTPMPTAVRDELELETKRTLDRASRWLLSNRPQPLAVGADITRYRGGVRVLGAHVPAWKPGAIADSLTARSQSAIDRGAPRELAEEVYLLIHRFPALDIIDVAELTERDPKEVADLYYALDQHFAIQRLLDAVVGLERTDRWRTLARLAVRDDLYDSLRTLTSDVLNATSPEDTPEGKVAHWESLNQHRLSRARATLEEIFTAATFDMATLSVAARQVRGLVSGGEVS